MSPWLDRAGTFTSVTLSVLGRPCCDSGLVALDLDDHLLEESLQQLLPVARRGCGRMPDGGEVRPEREDLGATDRPVACSRPDRAARGRAL
jgi:hypothetical protein